MARPVPRDAGSTTPTRAPDAGATRDEIALSWKRSASAGLLPSATLENASLGDVDRRSRLLSAANPILDRMESLLDGAGYCVVLADRNAQLVDMRFGTRGLRDAVYGLGVVPGRSFTEQSAGTNSISTTFELRAPLAVREGEHYVESMRRFSCYGYPLIHPVTRRTEGVLDITFLAAEDNPLLRPILVHSAHDIVGRLLDETRSGEQRLFHAFQDASARRHGAPVVALADEILLENTAAARMVGPVDHAVLRSMADDASNRRGAIARLTLDSGAVVSVCWTRPATASGSVFEIDPVDTPSRPMQTSPVSTVRPGREHPVTTAVIGEPGTGKTRWLHRSTAVTQSEWFDAADVLENDRSAWITSVRDAVDAGRDLVVENVHLFDAPLAHRVHEVLGAATGRVALSADAEANISEVRALLSLCARSVELLPLRLRRHEIPDIARDLLVRYGSAARFTDAAMTALIEYHWPGNVAELATEVREAAARRSVGDITERELRRPRRATAPAARTVLDTAVREVIVAELERHNGNKRMTAERLGISRTTLYKRMKEFSIAG